MIHRKKAEKGVRNIDCGPAPRIAVIASGSVRKSRLKQIDTGYS